ncbi:MAG: 3-phosphoshikimate 1-carboxyvinyltransferase [Candidatus Microthrix sp.]|uniref:3-phosphoshikimate 1-carboxyvinyltransferase n=1 Tax=Candidatus Neomicrothrix subdominans TaxID=2954438 RepID=A0A936N9J4_9ACTN|nr:3-phosphoshikimate 1-carboxyvinyltransferase [Candidatus Microthrix sp.]MBK9295591.1 3-phosphoshikimate 1-carboxyvinyltransferase [Candidatus Microthrix subdominans]MBK6438379.1 3-phosphoshikimate 1-carboxyvinyltransferase [Candidatus Microthrix sp.]MBK6970731.1 3-phosphoshikimate 1-carboxyvinyltransferase [Candidatus Microthrix sp.]MBK7165629.1 3-phosphoshikimate 1-carboxyvinyltransferase [Candidatus Microthrix sp.]MBP7596012.1 3-phosphoshikimate 1-carboxyvinyltransferase [Candidatus Micro
MIVDPLRLRRLTEPPDATVVLPGSKSLTNRALLCAGLAEGRSELTGVLFSDDTEAMLAALTGMGAQVEEDRPAHTVSITGIGGRLPAEPLIIDARQSGTTGRFLAPLIALAPGGGMLDGHEQLRTRPMSDQLEAMRSLGATLSAVDDRLPLSSTGGGMRGGAVTVSGATSSQFLSGLLLCAPLFGDGLQLEVADELVSRPYIDMTVDVMERFGAAVERDGYRRFGCAPGIYAAQRYAIEPDASAASYFFALAAMTRGRIRVEGLGRSAVQGDMAFLDVLEQMGAVVRQGDDWTEVVGRDLRGVDVDLADFSDTAPTLAVVAAVADSPTRIRGIGFVRGKESDRIGAVITELERLGIASVEHDDGLTVHPGEVRSGVVSTYEDHRLAMAFGLLGLVADGVAIADPGCVAKTFPTYWDVLEGARTQA